jgi:hypothetical protein
MQAPLMVSATRAACSVVAAAVPAAATLDRMNVRREEVDMVVTSDQ